MKRLLATLTVASLFAVGCSPAPTSPVAHVTTRAVLDCSNGNNGNNPPNTAGGGCGSTSPTNSSNNPPTTAGN